jgi:hypothetical protein
MPSFTRLLTGLVLLVGRVERSRCDPVDLKSLTTFQCRRAREKGLYTQCSCIYNFFPPRKKIIYIAALFFPARSIFRITVEIQISRQPARPAQFKVWLRRVFIISNFPGNQYRSKGRKVTFRPYDPSNQHDQPSSKSGSGDPRG